MDVHNDTAGLLALWLEPLGEDRWLRPGERFRVRSDYHGDELAFSVVFWDDKEEEGIQNITVWIENGDCDAEVTNMAGDVIECGHQRPAEIDAKWTAALAEARARTAARKQSREG